MMAPNALVADSSHEQEHPSFHYGEDQYSDSELDGGRGKGANGKPRTRLGYQRISIACCILCNHFSAYDQCTVDVERSDACLQLTERATDVKIALANSVNVWSNRLPARAERAVVIKPMRCRQIQCHTPRP